LFFYCFPIHFCFFIQMKQPTITMTIMKMDTVNTMASAGRVVIGTVVPAGDEVVVVCPQSPKIIKLLAALGVHVSSAASMERVVVPEPVCNKNQKETSTKSLTC
jgi:hypothetical protein